MASSPICKTPCAWLVLGHWPHTGGFYNEFCEIWYPFRPSTWPHRAELEREPTKTSRKRVICRWLASPEQRVDPRGHRGTSGPIYPPSCYELWETFVDGVNYQRLSQTIWLTFIVNTFIHVELSKLHTTKRRNHRYLTNTRMPKREKKNPHL